MQVSVTISQNSVSLQAGEQACTTHLASMHFSLALQLIPEPGIAQVGTSQRPFKHGMPASQYFVLSSRPSPHQVTLSPSSSYPSSVLPSQSLSRLSQISALASFCSST